MDVVAKTMTWQTEGSRVAFVPNALNELSTWFLMIVGKNSSSGLKRAFLFDI